MLPDMSDVLQEWSVPVILKTISIAKVDFVETKTVTAENIEAVVQPTDKEAIVNGGLDTSAKYMTFHSESEIILDQLIQYNNKDYLIVKDGDWDEYGYSEVIGQYTKKALVEATQ